MPTPTTKIQLMSDVPFGIDQKDVRLFASESARDTYFTSKVVKTFSNCVYQRQTSAPVGSNTRAESMKVACQRDSIDNCNYLRFQNADFSNKWYYAFILQKNYVNANTTEIVYQIDDWQTYFLNGELLPCIVEREHATAEEENVTCSVLDDIKFFTPEPIAPKRTIIAANVGKHFFFEDQTPCVIIVTNPWDDSSGGHPVPAQFTPFKYTTSGSALYDDFGTYATVWLWQFPINTGDARDFVSWLCGQFLSNDLNTVFIDAYVSPMTIQEAMLLNDSLIGTGTNLTKTEGTFQYAGGTGTTSYELRNKKLLFSPYRNWVFRSTQGDTQNNAPEEITTLCDVKARVYPDVFITLRPKTNDNADSWKRVVSFASHNQASFAGSAYSQSEAWKNNITPMSLCLKGLGAVSSMLVTAGGTGANALNVAAGMAPNAFDLIAKPVETYEVAQHTPDFQINNVTSADACYLNDRIGFEIMEFVPSPADCEAIDTYFDFYGYNAGNVLKIPRLEGRQYWNYVKTQNCKFDGDCPAESEQAIERIFNSGVRVWHVEQGNQVENPVAT